MATFNEAVKRWTGTINEWYGIDARPAEVENAFNVLKDYRDAKDEPDEEPYIETFFKDHNNEWCTGLDTVDREHLAGLVEDLRKIRTQTS